MSSSLYSNHAMCSVHLFHSRAERDKGEIHKERGLGLADLFPIMDPRVGKVGQTVTQWGRWYP